MLQHFPGELLGWPLHTFELSATTQGETMAPRLTVAFGEYEILRALKDGRVKVEGVELEAAADLVLRRLNVVDSEEMKVMKVCSLIRR